MSESPGVQPATLHPEPRGHPLISIWFEPGPTILQLAKVSPRRLFVPLAAIWGASVNLRLTIQQGISAQKLDEAGMTSVWMILAINLVLGAIFGVAVLWMGSFVFAWLGRLLGGVASAREVRTVLAWSSVPHIPNVLLAVLVLVTGGTAVLTAPHTTGTSISTDPLQMFFVVAASFLGVWGFVISVVGMKAIMGFGSLRALSVLVIGGLIVIAVAVISIIGVVQLAKL